jgi:hypothetical protein
MAPESVASPSEFRRYRRFVSWFVLAFVSVGSAYLLVSVGVTIYRRRNAVVLGAPVGHVASEADLESCAEELTEVEQGLERHLENFHDLVAHYDVSEAQRWSEDRSFWLGQWRAADQRCHFAQPRAGKHAKDWEQLSVVHADLKDTEALYTKELVRFGQDQAPRLDRIRERLEAVGKRLAASSADEPSTETKDEAQPQPNASQDSGDRK